VPVVHCPSNIDKDPQALQSLNDIINNFAKIEVEDCSIYYKKNDNNTLSPKLNGINLDL
jgi:hypothetical protein